MMHTDFVVGFVPTGNFVESNLLIKLDLPELNSPRNTIRMASALSEASICANIDESPCLLAMAYNVSSLLITNYLFFFAMSAFFLLPERADRSLLEACYSPVGTRIRRRTRNGVARLSPQPRNVAVSSSREANAEDGFLSTFFDGRSIPHSFIPAQAGIERNWKELGTCFRDFSTDETSVVPVHEDATDETPVVISPGRPKVRGQSR